MRLLVVGAGLQGRTIAADLASRRDVEGVALADIARPSPGGGPKVTPVELDATDPRSVAAI
ncbi:MAG: hypothetical protein ACT4PT_13585, partial [Methanobacteriota archaeon]